ncbi:MAG: MlaD family protein [Opitutaceae bacterium]|jgi:phospholipid/cholesterol/gamma-HCH transport system substrate-binding protein|nr:MlaD family protein [Opitutaceae bacterium]
MNQTQMTARVGLFFIIGVALVWTAWQALHDGGFSQKEGYQVTATFASLRELKPGDAVRMAGVPIGRVETVGLAQGRAQATLFINDAIAIASDATATIAMSGLIGSNYISLDLGTPSAAPVPPGGTLRTKDTPDLNQIMAEFGGIGQDIKNTIGQISGALGSGAEGGGGLIKTIESMVNENRDKLAHTMTNLEDITARLRNGEGTLGKLINDPAAYDNLLAAVREIKDAATGAKTFMNDAQGLFSQVKNGQGTLGMLLYDDATAAHLRTSVANLRQLTEKLNNENSTFGQLITNDELVRDVKLTLRKIDRAMDGAADSGPLTAVGVISNALF